jgi:tryptophanyl-tRNA synthetase
MADLTQRFIDTLNFHKEHPGAEDLDETGIAHVKIDQAHANHILSVIEEHQAGKTTDEEFKQQLLDILEHELFKPHETMSKTMVRNILKHDFGINKDPVPVPPAEPTDTV